MLGDDEHPISFQFDPELIGGHVHVKIRAGLRGMRGLCGTVMMRPEEWAVFESVARRIGQENTEAILVGDRRVYIDSTPFEITCE